MTATYTTPRTWVAGEIVTASLLNTHLRDMMDYLKARPAARASDLDGTVLSTSSTSFVDVTGASVSITTSGSSRLLILASGVFDTGAGVETIYVTAVVDGVNQGDSSIGFTQSLTNEPQSWSLVHLTSAAVSDGAHTVKLQARVSANSGDINAFSLVVLEVF